MGVVGAGDCERDEDAVEDFWGGPRAQADFDGSWGGIFDIDAVEDLGAGNCERDEDAVEEVCGGPRAQADFDGSRGGIFDVDVVEELLILRYDQTLKPLDEGYRGHPKEGCRRGKQGMPEG